MSFTEIHFSRLEEKKGGGGCSVEEGLGVCLEPSLQIQQLVATKPQ